ncbi:sulfatase-like hydrolase/transferase [Flagellimonas pacifica]|uniref:Arylsulfatase A n=1 Tax=Flagellimonas pacifica TaxID=1247520 RepID=A0A285MCR1_9FLAO|nr:sulfatase-like hydrolase/transferase [Allomuricauda parva]SNY94972.1 Arylsulfatase A [Allomuricauda parva]
MNRLLFFLGFAALILTNISCKEKEKEVEKEKTPPNIVFIFADDQSYNTIKTLGNDEVHTPNLDKLANSGVAFTHTYNMGGWNGAICVASRAMLLTGQYIWNAHKADSLMRANSYQQPLWGNIMTNAGYNTYMTGKWHVTKPAEEVFENVVHVRPGMPNQTEEGYNRPLSETDTIWRPWDKSKNGFWKGGTHWSEVVADDASKFIADAIHKDNPFFMYLAFNAPHDPRQSPEKFVQMFPLDSIELPTTFLTEYPYNEEMGSGRKLRDERLAPFPRTEYSVKVNRQEYYAVIAHMDEQIGKILDALEASGEMENTYIVFTADHGLSVGQHGLLGKQNMYDHSVRTPLFVVGPNIPKNKKIDADVYLQDVMPTILELAGAEKPDFVQFKSLMPLIKGERSTNYESIYGCYTNTQRMVRTDGFKLIAYPNASKLRLFDLTNDPLEMNDLADDPKYASTKNTLWKELLSLQKTMNDPLNLEDFMFN